MAVLMIGFGLYYLFTHETYSKDTQGTVTNVKSCKQQVTSNDNQTNVNYLCTLTVSYTVNNKKYTNGNISTDGETIYKVGDTLTLQYDPNNPKDSRSKRMTRKQTGTALLIIGVIIMAISWFWVWVTQKYKAAAAFAGAGAGFNMARNIF
jgi:hypothetical protein